jgi:hypothetical protein
VHGERIQLHDLEVNVITWLLTLLIAMSVVILVAHAIDAMR